MGSPEERAKAPDDVPSEAQAPAALAGAPEPSRAVFLSYASQDAEAARKICDALCTAGIEVWFDRSELRGGDVWDQKIGRQIRDCALFIPLVSASTASRHEGYFRLEWDLADQRTHMMARDRTFIVPVSLDGTPSAGTDMPARRVCWQLSGQGALERDERCASSRASRRSRRR